MCPETRKKIRGWVFPIASYIWGVYEVINQLPDYTAMTWAEIGSRALKASPFIIAGLVMRSMIVSQNGKDEDPPKQG